MPDYKFKEFPCTCDLSSPKLCQGCMDFMESESFALDHVFSFAEREEC